MYGIPFILLGNLAGNALALGRYIMFAAGDRAANGQSTASQGKVTAIAIVALTLVILVHMCTRRGGLVLNNIFGALKVIFLLAIVVIGLAYRGNRLPEKDKIGGLNYSSPTSFGDLSHSTAGYAESLLVVMYSYSGYEQPFYVS
jgi:amino acid transporter